MTRREGHIVVAVDRVTGRFPACKIPPTEFFIPATEQNPVVIDDIDERKVERFQGTIRVGQKLFSQGEFGEVIDGGLESGVDAWVERSGRGIVGQRKRGGGGSFMIIT